MRYSYCEEKLKAKLRWVSRSFLRHLNKQQTENFFCLLNLCYMYS